MSAGGGKGAGVPGESLRTLARLKRVDFEPTRLDRLTGRTSASVTTLSEGRDEFSMRLTSVGVVLSAPGLDDQLIPMHLVRKAVIR